VALLVSRGKGVPHVSVNDKCHCLDFNLVPINVSLIQFTLQENASLVTNFSDQKLLVTIIINLDTSLQSKKTIGY